MANPEVAVNIEEVEPTLEELEYSAAKQLSIELRMIQRRIFESGTLMNGVLIVQIKGVLASLIKKYNEFGLLGGENVKLKLSQHGRMGQIYFEYTPRLNKLMDQVIQDAQKQMKEENETTSNDSENS